MIEIVFWHDMTIINEVRARATQCPSNLLQAAHTARSGGRPFDALLAMEVCGKIEFEVKWLHRPKSSQP